MPAQKATAIGGLGYAAPENFWNLEAIKLLLGLFLTQYDASWRPDRIVLHAWTSTLSADCIVLAVLVRLSDRSLISQATDIYKACNLGRMASCWKKSFFALFADISQACVGVRRATPLICDIKEATSGGESGPRIVGMNAKFRSGHNHALSKF